MEDNIIKDLRNLFRINPINTNAVTVTLIHEEIGKNSQRLSKAQPFISKYNCKEINYPFKKDDWKKSEKNNLAIVLNVLYAKNEKI